MEQPIIFLDIDGVIATDKEFMMNRTKFRMKYPEAKELHIPYPFNKGCVDILNHIIEETNPKIVISSDWRLHWDLVELDSIFKFNGVLKSPEDKTIISGKFGGLLNSNRVFEISNYIETHKIKTWVAIDDLDLSELGENFVRTVSDEGLKQTGIKKKILTKLKL